jgi:2-amino-4-hydroxy-6-hydroxymethyldihydropteridine diphosphokinase
MRPSAGQQISQFRNPVVVALGSNLGDSAKTLEKAFERLEELSQRPLLKSSIWKTAPVDCPPGSPDFCNAVVILDPHGDETPETLLAKLQDIEREFGRQPKKIINEARPLDLDLIAFGTELRNMPTLTLPHPRAHERRFVLEPLAEIAPDYFIPGQARTAAELLRDLPRDPFAVKSAR